MTGSVVTSMVKSDAMTAPVPKLLSQQVKLSSARQCPYPNRPRPCTKRSWKTSNLAELLRCHTVRSDHSFPLLPVNADILVADIGTHSCEPVFASYTGFQRAARADVQQIFNKTASLHSEDDQTDVVYTADDVECFDERKRLAKELDSMI